MHVITSFESDNNGRRLFTKQKKFLFARDVVGVDSVVDRFGWLTTRTGSFKWILISSYVRICNCNVVED